MKHLLLISFFISSLLVTAQFGPQKILSSKSHINPEDAKAFDLDGDGDMDILSASANNISWNENEGAGVFGHNSQGIISETLSNSAVDAADLDGDGDLDVFAVLSGIGAAWFENDGNGNFGPQLMISNEITSIQSIYSADMDDDGDIDVLSASFIEDKIMWYENEGGGIFSSEQIITFNTQGVHSVYAADLDEDGDMDVLSSSRNDDKIAWYENEGGGIFSSELIITNEAEDATVVYAADLDGDGDIDVLSAILITERGIVWYENLGNGIFGSSQIISTETSLVYTADLDGDGDMDVLTASMVDDDVYWYENNGNGIFGPQEIITSNAYFTQSIYAADLDEDGDMDVLSASRGDDEIAWYENENEGVFGTQQIISTSTLQATSVYTADLDGDGDLDVISASGLDDKIAWYKNLGNGNFGHQKVITPYTDGAVFVYAADLDNDGDQDVLSASRDDDKVAWYENFGNGNFGPQQIITTDANYIYSIYATDLDGDGDIDVLSAKSSENKIAWYENEGMGIFSSEQIISAFGARSVYAADLDGDQDMDVLSATLYNDNIAWYENLGSGTFSSHLVITSEANSATSVYAADMDNDGDMDVLSASDGDDKVAWYENDGSGNFGSQQIISPIGYSAQYVYAADLDGDGDLDVISAAGNKVVWYENYGSGNFSFPQIITLEVSMVYSAVAADLDEDGDMDVLSASVGDDKIAWYENTSYHNMQVSGRLFLDINQNGIHDSLDAGFNQLSIISNPQSDYTYTFPNGNYFMNFSDTSGSYLIFPGSLSNWDLTTDSLDYSILVDSNSTFLDSLDFGFYPNTIETAIQADLTGALPRCNDNINYWIKIHNLGTSLPSGIIHLQLADSINYISSAIEPDSITGQNIYWHYDSLFYFSSTSINLVVEMPPFTSMGDILSSVLVVHELDEENNINYSNSDTLNQVSVCAYDPNDKSVNPAGVGEEGYITQNQELEYLIRFQNTGNDTAITVVIRDQLHENLDWSTLQPIASSHSMQVHVQQTGEAVFTFENIMLPDSNVNFLESQGFVKFSVMPDEGLLPNTPIQNTANIYFDQNPAVVTNTVLNTIECYDTPQPIVSFTSTYLNAGVSGDFTYQWFYNGEEIPGAISDTLTPVENGLYSVSITDIYNCEKVSEGYLFNSVGIGESNLIKAVVYPNPFSESTSIVFAQNLNGEYDLLVNDVLGRQVKRINKIEGNTVTLHRSDLGKGAFLCYVVNNRTGKKVFIEKLIIQ